MVDKKVEDADVSPVLSQTSLVPSDGSPLLEAHPGSPVDLTGRRPSLSSAMASASLCPPSERQVRDSYRFQTSPKFMGITEELVRRDGVAAKECSNKESSNESEAQTTQRKMQVAGFQSFYIPAKVPEHDKVQTISAPVCVSEDDMSCDTAMRFLCPSSEYSGTASPLAHESHTSLATTSTMVSDAAHTPSNLTIDTSVNGSDGTTSMLSSCATSVISSTISASSTDTYGWEEELDRKVSIEGYNGWKREPPRPLPSGGRSGYQSTRIARARGVEDFQQYRYKRGGGKRKSLLYRVLNLSSREHKRTAVIEEERISSSGAFVEPSKPTPLTSAIGIES